MTKSNIVHNEQTKLVASIVQTLATALFIGAAGIYWTEGWVENVLWFSLGSVVMWIISYAMLLMLRGS
ncbi:hypothetical protein ELI_03090 [Erythrobacter litoralis HTCC2594]|uniref:Uncharacterized protein n=1 Tax=Erythrobacter litoralis (strain HTCC2594) TaxID=314225 RepID=Q2NC81_ERYLH|nr:hypothetical protein ELI_03090 [Erythrobacter litoralis HTCC2594]